MLVIPSDLSRVVVLNPSACCKVKEEGRCWNVSCDMPQGSSERRSRSCRDCGRSTLDL